MTRNTKYAETEWNDLLFHVDVEVIYVEDIIKEYKILKVYDDVKILDE